MTVDEIRPGLWRWTVDHPDWRPEDGGPDGWQPEVGCVYVEGDDGIALVDPQVPVEPESRVRFWRALDGDVERVGRPVAVLLTTHWHERSSEDVRARFGAEIWAASSFADHLTCSGVRTFECGDPLPGGIVAHPTSRPGQVVLWIPAHAALVPGDVLVGDSGGGVRVCPDAWLDGSDAPAEVRAALRPLLELPVERVLVSHGRPVLADGRAAIADALRR